MTQPQYHQTYSPDDGSRAIRRFPGSKWELMKGDADSSAAKFVKEQNRHWPDWIKESVRAYQDK